MANIGYAIKVRFHKYLYKLYGLGFRTFGKGTVVLHPLFISGKSNISLGENVFIRDGVRIEVVEKWGGGNARQVSQR